MTLFLSVVGVSEFQNRLKKKKLKPQASIDVVSLLRAPTEVLFRDLRDTWWKILAQRVNLWRKIWYEARFGLWTLYRHKYIRI